MNDIYNYFIIDLIRNVHLFCTLVFAKHYIIDEALSRQIVIQEIDDFILFLNMS